MWTDVLCSGEFLLTNTLRQMKVWAPRALDMGSPCLDAKERISQRVQGERIRGA